MACRSCKKSREARQAIKYDSELPVVGGLCPLCKTAVSRVTQFIRRRKKIAFRCQSGHLLKVPS